MSIYRLLVVLNLVLAPSFAFSNSFQNNSDVDEFILELVSEYEFSEKQLRSYFSSIRYQPSIIEALTRPAEKTKAYVDYKPMFISEDTIKRGRVFAEKHRVALERAEYVYGVPSEVILSIIAIETRFGRLKGSYRVMDALATIGFFYPRRATYFKKELREFLILTREQKLDPFEVKGSYAGAMGYPQFMPSSYRAYAVDFDFDGKTDIWNNPIDAIGSVASYFAEHGWTRDEQVTIKASVSGQHFESVIPEKFKLQTTAKEAKEAGWQPEKDIADTIEVLPYQLETESGMEYWLGLKNFYVITRYNRSHKYAMTVHQLSQAFRESNI